MVSTEHLSIGGVLMQLGQRHGNAHSRACVLRGVRVYLRGARARGGGELGDFGGSGE